jgi:hypothetical protein
MDAQELQEGSAMQKPKLRLVEPRTGNAVPSSADSASDVLSDGRSVRAVANQIWLRCRELGASFTVRRGVERAWTVAHREMLAGMPNPVDRLKLLDFELEIVDLAADMGLRGHDDTQQYWVERRKRDLRRRTGHRFILTEDATGLEREAQRWLATGASPLT